MARPKVSVVMSAYNGEGYLRESVESILNQTFTDFEFIIVDDGSTDGTWDILTEYAGQDQRIALVKNLENIGLTKSLNKGLALAKGGFIARQDADDISCRERLAYQVCFLDEFPDVGVLGTWVAYINKEGHQESVWETPARAAIVKWSLLFGNCIAHPSVMLRHFLVKGGIAYRSEISYAQDYELWVRLSDKTQLNNLPEVLYLRRVHEQMIGIKNYEQQEQTVREVMRYAQTELLGNEVSERMVSSLRHATRRKNLEKAVELRAVSNLIIHLCRAYITQNILDTVGRKQVIEDAAQRLEKLAFRHIRRWPMDANRVLLQAVLLRRRIPDKLCLKKWLMESLRRN
jgi:glycosyltransferase involved in cell wall biosynthesis